MKRALILLFLIPAAIVIFIETNRGVYQKQVLLKPDQRFPFLVAEQWMGIYFKGKKLGFSYTALFRGDNGFRRTSRAIIKLSSSDATLQETSFNQETFLSEEKKLLSFRFSQEMSGHAQVVEGVYEGGKMKMQIFSSGAVSKKEIPLPEESVTGGTLDFYIMKKGLIPGTTFPVHLFIEPLQTVVAVEISVIGFETVNIQGKKVKACKIMEKFKGLSAYTWITEDGKIVKEVSLEGLESRLEPREQALHFDDPISVNSFITYSLIRTQKRVVNQADLEYIRVKVTGLTKTGLIPEDGRQVIEEEKRDSTGLISAILKVNSKYSIKESSGTIHDRYLAPTPEIQSDYPDILTKASQITGAEQDSHKKALLILKWVFDYMDKKPVDTFTAVDALHTAEGECQSHANLFAALSRASKIPTRIVSGLVYSEKERGFLYHAWPEVYVEQWIAMDPTFGQERADPTHIKLATGGWDQQLNLLNFIGKISIEVVESL